MDVPIIDEYHSVMNVSKHFNLTSVCVRHILYDHKFDEYFELPHWVLFTAQVCIIHEILEIKTQTSDRGKIENY